METEPGWHLGYLTPEDQEKAVAELRGRGPCGPVGAQSWHYRQVK
jgi:hypothetical protein